MRPPGHPGDEGPGPPSVGNAAGRRPSAVSPLWGLSPTERNCLVKVVPPSRDVLIPGLMAEWVSRLHSRPSSARASWGTAKASVGSASQPSFSLCPNPASFSFQMLSPGTTLISLLCCNVVHLRVCCLGSKSAANSVRVNHSHQTASSASVLTSENSASVFEQRDKSPT